MTEQAVAKPKRKPRKAALPVATTGRPSKLTPQVWETVITVLRNTGCSRALAARHAEIAPSTLSMWIGELPAFANAVEKAESDYQVGLLARARAHAQVDARSATFLIERHPALRAEWGAKSEGLAVTVPIEVNVTHVDAGAAAAAVFDRLADVGQAFDILVRAGLARSPELLATGGAAAPRLVGGSDDAQVDEVHPA